MITVSDLFEHVKINSGQLLVDSDILEIRDKHFLRLVRESLALYQDYKPYTRRFNISTSSSSNSSNKTQYTYTFTEENDEYVPDWIPKCTPISGYGTKLSTTNYIFGYINQRQSFYWDYEKPVLYLPYSGGFDIEAGYEFFIREVSSVNEEGETIISYEVPFITHDDKYFFDLLAGKFTVALALIRANFNHQDNPIQFYTNLYNHGKTMEDTAIRNMQTFSKYYLSRKR